MQIINNIGEPELMNRIGKGDRSAFDRVFRRYYPGLVIFASRFTLDQSAAEEIVQDFFVKLWEKRSDFSCNSMKAYFFSAVRNRCLNYLKHRKVEQTVIEDLRQFSRQSLLFDPDLYVEGELHEKINRAVNALPQRCREIFLMSRFDGMKNEEVAKKLNLSKRTVETHISNALASLRRDLKEYAGLFILGGIFGL